MIDSKKKDKLKTTEKILISFWLLILFSINSSIDNLFLINNIKKLFINHLNLYDFLNNFHLFKDSIFIVLNFFRTVSVFGIFFIIIIWTLNKKKKINFFIIFFFLFSLWQIVALHINKLENIYINRLENYRIIVSSLSTIGIFYLAHIYNNKKIYKKFIYCLIFFISLISLFFSARLTIEFLLNSNIFSLYGTETLGPESQTFLQPTPRITGIARMLVIIFYFFFFFNKYLKDNKFNSFFYILLFFISLLIYGMETRGGIIGILIFVFYYIFIFNEKKILKLKTVCLLIILPIIFWHTLIIVKKNYITHDNKSENFFLNSNQKSNLSLQPSNLRVVKIDTSGRLDIWIKSLKIIKENKIIWGVGPKGDRALLTDMSIQNYNLFNPEQRIIYDNNSSNALIYSYLSGGIISAFFLILIYYVSVKQIVTSLFKKKFTEQKFLTNFSHITLIFLLLRSIFENGFAIFGLDFCIFILCNFFLFRENLIKKSRKFI